MCQVQERDEPRRSRCCEQDRRPPLRWQRRNMPVGILRPFFLLCRVRHHYVIERPTMPMSASPSACFRILIPGFVSDRVKLSFSDFANHSQYLDCGNCHPKYLNIPLKTILNVTCWLRFVSLRTWLHKTLFDRFKKRKKEWKEGKQVVILAPEFNRLFFTREGD